MRWFHFSDIHFNFEGYDTKWMRERLVEYLKDFKAPDASALFITGDFRFAPDKEFKNETKEYIKKIQNCIGNENTALYISAGNHDLDRNESRTAQIASTLKGYDASKGTLSIETLRYLNVAFDEFNEFISDSAGKVIREQNPHRFIESEEINIVCINTSIVSGIKSADEYGQLIVGINFLEDCFKQVNVNKPIIAYGHHSLESLRYDEQVRVIELFQKYNVHVYLCGHNHIFKVNNVSYDEKYKLYEIFAGNLYTEDRYSQCGFLEADLKSDNYLEIKCHEWDFNARKWHLSNTYSDEQNNYTKILKLYEHPLNKNNDSERYKNRNPIKNVMMLPFNKAVVTVPIYKKKFYKKTWPIVHFNEFQYTLKLMSAISSEGLEIETEYNVTYQFSEIHIGGPTVNVATYQYIMNFIPSYKAIVKKGEVPRESRFLNPNFIQIGEQTGFSVVDKRGNIINFYRDDWINDIGILIRLKINNKKVVHLIFGTGKRGTLVALNYLTNYAEDISKKYQDKNYFLLLWGNYINYSIDFSKGIQDLSDCLEM